MRPLAWAKTGRYLPLALLSLVLVALVWPLVQGEVLYWGLPAIQFQPWRQYVMQVWASGTWPLWNPLVGGGAPLLANYQSALLYPPHVLYFLDSSPHMMGWLSALHVLWAGLGMWGLARYWRMGVLGQGILTLAFPLCNTLLVRFSTFPMLEAAAWLPWLVWMSLRLVQMQPSRAGQRLAALLALTVVAAMQLLAGHAQWTFYSWLFAGGWVAWGVLRRRAWSAALWWLAALAFAILLAAVQLLPTAELQRLSQRADRVNEQVALNFSYPYISLLGWLYPNVLGHPGDGSYSVGGAHFEIAAYIGVLPLLLAGMALWGLMRRRSASPTASPADSTDPPRPALGYLALVALIALLFAFGSYFPLYPLLYRYVPTFNLFQAPSRWLLLTCFALVVIAAHGAESFTLLWRIKRNLRLLLALAFGLILMGSLGTVLLSGAVAQVRQLAYACIGGGVALAIAAIVLLVQPKRDTLRFAQWQVLLLVVLAADLWWANRLNIPTVAADFYAPCQRSIAGRTFVTEAAQAAMYTRYMPFDNYPLARQHAREYRCSDIPNLRLLDNLPAYSNFDPLRPAWFETVGQLLQQPPAPNLLQAAAIEQWIGADDQRTATVNRVWLVDHVLVRQAAAVAQDMQHADWSPYQTAIVEGISEPRGLVRGDAAIINETAQSLTIRTAANGPSFLVLADTYYPGWQATVDGIDSPIYRTNLAFRGMLLTAGTHTVVMTYQPTTWRIGSLLSLAALVAYTVLLVTAWWQARR